ncbi:MAG: acyltransferase domain-containing protein, partial [Leuconostoc fallax]
MKIGLLFSGQGAQQVGMGADLYANVPEYQQVIDRASQVLGYDLAQLTAEDEQKLAQTQYVQPAILA